MSQASFNSHSAEVEMWLECGSFGRVMLSRITPKSVVAKTPRDIPAGVADLVVTVDGKRLSSRVMLPSGFSKDCHLALIRPVSDAAAPF
jgi:hypothetical protein